MQYTKHALDRHQHRGISIRAHQILDEFGSYFYLKKGLYHVTLCKKGILQLKQKYGKRAYKVLEKYSGIYRIQTEQGVVITVGHKLKHFKRG